MAVYCSNDRSEKPFVWFRQRGIRAAGIRYSMFVSTDTHESLPAAMEFPKRPVKPSSLHFNSLALASSASSCATCESSSASEMSCDIPAAALTSLLTTELSDMVLVWEERGDNVTIYRMISIRRAASTRCVDVPIWREKSGKRIRKKMRWDAFFSTVVFRRIPEPL